MNIYAMKYHFYLKRKTKNLNKIKTALNKVLLNPILNYPGKRSKISNIIQPIVSGLVMKVKLKRKRKKFVKNLQRKHVKINVELIQKILSVKSIMKLLRYLLINVNLR